MIYIFSPPRHGSTIISEVLAFSKNAKFYCEDRNNYPFPKKIEENEISILKMPFLCFEMKKVLNDKDYFVILNRELEEVTRSYKNYNKHPQKSSSSLGVKYKNNIIKDPKQICILWKEFTDSINEGENIIKVNFSLFNDDNKVTLYKNLFNKLKLDFSSEIEEKINELVSFSGKEKPSNYSLKAETTRWY